MKALAILVITTAAALAGAQGERSDCELRGHFVGHDLTACAIVLPG